ncbi:hypothetical protein [Aquibium sp. ELW1220]|uniref:hypothetical protein n=1 Tax=Aquibium sp. ELW1220 TaxID=2976766 RepID=UPI0025B1C16C|nr:hypothetical protein [Aquibium sp. ELW1220]MDN2582504.1 hypothetical protein [Aquibium sp. ELW1220]
MVGGVGGNYSVTKTFTRNVEQADVRYAKKHDGEKLAKAPNQNIETGTRGAFKNSFSFFADSFKGFLETPFGKKLDFLKDRIELRSIQKGEVAEQKTAQRSDRRDAALAGGKTIKFEPPSSKDSAKALEMLKDRGSGNERLLAQLTVSLGKWVGEAEAKAKENDTDLKTEMRRIAASLASNIGDEDFKILHLPQLRDIAAQLRSEFRHEKAEMLEEIVGAFSQVVTHDKAVEKYHDTARTYISDFRGEPKMFWRNNQNDGEKALKSLVSHGFTNELGNRIGNDMKPMRQTETFRSIDIKPPTHLDLSETQAKDIGRFAESILQKLESFTLTEQMKDTLRLVSNDIAELRPNEKGPMTRQFFLNAIFLKSVASAQAGSQTFQLAMRMVTDALNAQGGSDTPFAKETNAFRQTFGQRMEEVLVHFGMPEYARR